MSRDGEARDDKAFDHLKRSEYEGDWWNQKMHNGDRAMTKFEYTYGWHKTPLPDRCFTGDWRHFRRQVKKLKIEDVSPDKDTISEEFASYAVTLLARLPNSSSAFREKLFCKLTELETKVLSVCLNKHKLRSNDDGYTMLGYEEHRFIPTLSTKITDLDFWKKAYTNCPSPASVCGDPETSRDNPNVLQKLDEVIANLKTLKGYNLSSDQALNHEDEELLGKSLTHLCEAKAGLNLENGFGAWKRAFCFPTWPILDFLRYSRKMHVLKKLVLQCDAKVISTEKYGKLPVVLGGDTLRDAERGIRHVGVHVYRAERIAGRSGSSGSDSVESLQPAVSKTPRRKLPFFMFAARNDDVRICFNTTAHRPKLFSE